MGRKVRPPLLTGINRSSWLGATLVTGAGDSEGVVGEEAGEDVGVEAGEEAGDTGSGCCPEAFPALF